MPVLTSIQISREDYSTLHALLRSQKETLQRLPEALCKLEEELRRADIVENGHLGDDVIALNGTARLKDLEEGDIMEFQLVLPHNADASEGRISILAPLGMAMLGYRKGNIIEWEVPCGTVKLEVLDVNCPRKVEVE